MDAREPSLDDLLEQLRQKTASREGMELKVYEGPNRLKILVQEQQLENSDLIDEHWTEVWNPEDAQKRNISVRRMKENMAVTLLVVAGDKASGKTTFFAGLTSGHLHILQAFRYNQASFFNVWYSPELKEIQELLHPAHRVEPFFQTALAHGYIHLPTAEFDFFRTDEEFAEETEGADGTMAEPNLQLPSSIEDGGEGPQSILVKLLEIGGDFIQDLMAMANQTIGQDPSTVNLSEFDQTKEAILHSVLQYLHQCTSLAYFINLDALFVHHPTHIEVNPDAFRNCLGQLNYLGTVLPAQAHILFYCSRSPDVSSLPQSWTLKLTQQIAKMLDEAAPEPSQPLDALLPSKTEVEQFEIDPISALPAIIRWMMFTAAKLFGWPFALRGFYRTDHLNEATGAYDFTAILRSLHRLLRTSTFMNLDNLGLIAQQIINIAYDYWEKLIASQAFTDESVPWFTLDTLRALLDNESETPEALDDVLHPMPRFPPMVLLDHFEPVHRFLTQASPRLGLPYFNGKTSNTCIKWDLPEGDSLFWFAKPSGPTAEEIMGFRLPMYPETRLVLRRAIDLLSGVSGMELPALATHLQSLAPKIQQHIEREMWEASRSCFTETSPSLIEASWGKVVWLIEERALLLGLAGYQDMPLVGPFSVNSTQWKRFAELLRLCPESQFPKTVSLAWDVTAAIDLNLS